MFAELARKAAAKKAESSTPAASAQAPTQAPSLYAARSSQLKTNRETAGNVQIAIIGESPNLSEAPGERKRARDGEDQPPATTSQAAPSQEILVDWSSERTTFLNEALRHSFDEAQKNSSLSADAAAINLLLSECTPLIATWAVEVLLSDVADCAGVKPEDMSLTLGRNGSRSFCLSRLWYWISIWKRSVLKKHLSIEVLKFIRKASCGGPSGISVVESYKKVVEVLNAAKQIENLSKLIAVDALSVDGTIPAGPRCVPDDFLENLQAMFRQLDSREYLQAENTYLQLAVGSSQWHLGLCNGGEVHMRKHMAKLQRGNVTHILNNEAAMKMLHTVKRIISFARDPSAF